MKPANKFADDMLDLNMPEAKDDIVFAAGRPTNARSADGAVILEVPFKQRIPYPKEGTPVAASQPRRVVVRAYGEDIVRVSMSAGESGAIPGDDSVMLEMHPSLKGQPLNVRKAGVGFEIFDSAGAVRMKIDLREADLHHWSDLWKGVNDDFAATVWPDGKTEVPFKDQDQFSTTMNESLSIGYIQRGGGVRAVTFSLAAGPNEHFAGTGERFRRMDLAGQMIVLENIDALGANSRRAYKNVPFYVSSRPYGLLALTTCHARLSLADVSTRAAQGLIEDDTLDLFFIGGGSLERILYNYRRLSGFPRPVPLWSYGTWMSRMTYFSAEQVSQIANRLRAEKFPCDVLHIDTGWFAKDWQCDWEFSKERFPDPPLFMRKMRDMGFRISLWQTPSVARQTEKFNYARDHGLLPRKAGVHGEDSALDGVQYGGRIDFTNPDATAWYQGLLENLLRMGASVIKTDFGEKVEMNAIFKNMTPAKLHNVYALLYQKAAFEVTEKVLGKGQSIIWARSGWVGAHRYPVHWGGDAASTWDGLAGTIRGGLHIGLSGWAFWSHDVPGFHGLPDFMNSKPNDDLYVRWTQLGVFSSHLRYHGTCPREPWEYPAVADIVRKWLNLRYCLIPYLADQGELARQSGYPILRAMVFHHADDPVCWHVDDQFYCGEAFLVAPVIGKSGVRDVYLPAGEWIDFWTGSALKGPCWLRSVKSPLSQIPVFARKGAKIRVYPHIVQSTNEMDLSRCVELKFDKSYRGLARSVLQKALQWD